MSQVLPQCLIQFMAASALSAMNSLRGLSKSESKKQRQVNWSFSVLVTDLSHVINSKHRHCCSAEPIWPCWRSFCLKPRICSVCTLRRPVCINSELLQQCRKSQLSDKANKTSTSAVKWIILGFTSTNTSFATRVLPHELVERHAGAQIQTCPSKGRLAVQATLSVSWISAFKQI